MNSNLRQPNTAVHSPPVDDVGVPDEIRIRGQEMAEARQRYFEMVREHERADDTIRDAQDADAVAVREAVATGKQPPRPKAPTAIRAAAELEPQIEAARTLANEAEDRYLEACRNHRTEWLDAQRATYEQMVAREDEVIEELRRVRLGRLNADKAYREIEQLGAQAKLKNPAKANMRALLDLRPITKLDTADERRLAEFREDKRDGYPVRGGLVAA